MSGNPADEPRAKKQKVDAPAEGAKGSSTAAAATATTTTNPSSASLSADTCAICLNDITELCRVRPCGHRFDKDCIKSSLERDDRCPTCRDVIGEVDVDFKPDKSCTIDVVRHPEEHVTDITPHIKLRYLRSDETALVEVITDKDGEIIFKAHGREDKFPITKDQSIYLPKIFASDEHHRSFIIFPGEDGVEQEHQILMTEDESDDEDDEAGGGLGGAQNPIAAALAEHEGILLILNYLRERLETIDGRAASAFGSDDDSDAGADSPAASPDGNANNSSPAADEAPATDTPAPEPVPVVIPPDEELVLEVTPGITLKYMYPNAFFVSLTTKDMVILKLKDGDDEASHILRAGSASFLSSFSIRTSNDIIKHDGKEYPLSEKYKALIVSRDQVTGYSRPSLDDDDDDEDDDDSSDEDSPPSSPPAPDSPPDPSAQ